MRVQICIFHLELLCLAGKFYKVKLEIKYFFIIWFPVPCRFLVFYHILCLVSSIANRLCPGTWVLEEGLHFPVPFFLCGWPGGWTANRTWAQLMWKCSLPHFSLWPWTSTLCPSCQLEQWWQEQTWQPRTFLTAKMLSARVHEWHSHPPTWSIHLSPLGRDNKQLKTYSQVTFFFRSCGSSLTFYPNLYY